MCQVVFVRCQNFLRRCQMVCARCHIKNVFQWCQEGLDGHKRASDGLKKGSNGYANRY